jgi:glycosyltransferase involved in cell wall biosynthesis
MKIDSAPKVSVVCAWYNRADYIRDTVDSLLAQDFDSFEIVIINDGSPDPRVKEILDSYEDPRLRVIHQENTGFTVAIRRAIEESRGEYIAIQGAGDVSKHNRIRVQSDYLDQYTDAGAIGSWGTVKRIGSTIYETKKQRQKRVYHYKDVMGFNPFIHGSMMLRRNAYTSVGGYRAFFRFAQDRDLWCRMSHKYEMHMIHEDLYESRQFSEDGGSTSIEKKIVQVALSDMAVQFSKTRQRLGWDELEAFGESATYFRADTLRFFQILFYAWVVYRRGNEPAKADLVERAIRRRSKAAHLVFLLIRPVLIGSIRRMNLDKYGPIERLLSSKVGQFY